MNEIALDTPVGDVEVNRPQGAAARSQATWRDDVRAVLAPVASLRLTVVLFILSAFVVLAGTLAQRFAGIDTVLRVYFRSLYVWVPVNIFFPTSWGVPDGIVFPFFGGWLLGGALLTNLLAAHAVRFQLSWKRSGMLLLHAGIVVMMLSEFITGMFAVEGNMTIKEGESVNYVDVSDRLELAVIDRSNPDAEQVVAIPGSILRAGGMIKHDKLPIDVEVIRYMVNSDVSEAKRVRAAIVPFGESTWFLKVSGAVAEVDALRTAFDQFVRSIRFSDDSAKPITWTVPDGWHEHAGQGMRYAEFHVGPHSADPLVVTVTRLGRDSGTVLANVNRWRDQIGLGELDESELAAATTTAKLEGATATLVDFATHVSGNLATAGDGLTVIAHERKPFTGTDPNQGVDATSAYVRLKNKASGESLGTYLVSLWFYSNYTRRQLADRPQHVTIDGKPWELMLRFERSYKDYTVHLMDFNHDVYVGTNTAKDFSSFVRVLDPTRNTDREVRVWMNHPLRHAGETFYQSAFLPDDDGTVLQVVRNPGWLMPYVSCGMVAVGMLIHFCLALHTFLGRSAAKLAAAGDAAAIQSLWAPAGVVLLSALYLFSRARSPNAGELMKLDDFAQLPIVDGGRVKPVDTLARNSLMVIADKQTFRDENGRRQPAIRWLLDVLSYRLYDESEHAPAAAHKVFRIDNTEVLDLLSLEPRPGSWRYSIDEFRAKMAEFEDQARRADQTPAESRTLFQAKVIELAQHLTVFMKLAAWETPHHVPPTAAGGEWMELLRAAVEARQTGEVSGSLKSWVNILKAYKDNDVSGFNLAVADYRGELDALLPDDMPRMGFEVFFNRFAPFYHCSVLYVGVFLLACFTWLTTGFARPDWAGGLRRAGLWLPVLTLAVHTSALFSRMYLMDRPFVFVTNLYSSAVFIGWGTVVLGIVLEGMFRNSIGSAMSGLTGFLSLIVAHHLARAGDTLEMMQAVLDTNFWLATHVTCVTAGYAATFVAGFLGLVYIVAGLFRGLDKESAKSLGRMIYGVACFATLLSFTGTVLGGIWADQSWGRFWGWDPKENGALLIVIWNALILHARWGGMIRERGVASLAILGNVVTAWSWFGTNLLGVGLHAYGGGAMTSLQTLSELLATPHFWLITFMLSQTLVGALGGLTPRHMWESR